MLQGAAPEGELEERPELVAAGHVGQVAHLHLPPWFSAHVAWGDKVVEYRRVNHGAM